MNSSKRGDVLTWRGDGPVTFLLLEDRRASERTAIDGRTLCLVLEGEVHGRLPGQTVRLKAIVDLAVEAA